MSSKTTDNVLLALLLLLAVIFLLSGLVSVYEDKKQEQWPLTHGKILDSGRWYARNPPYTWFADFEYSVNKKTYRGADEGDKFGQPMFMTSTEAALYAESHYPKGKEVNVYYDPSNPSKAILNQGIQHITLMGFLLAAFFSFVAICIQFPVVGARAKKMLGTIFRSNVTSQT